MSLVHVSLVITMLLSAAPSGQLSVEITSPQDSAVIEQSPFVQGTVSDTAATVFIVVHPMETSEYWVQPQPSIRKSGLWRVQIHVGDPGPAHKGKHFELMAIANPEQKLNEGKKLTRWPTGQAKSDIIEVIRK